MIEAQILENHKIMISKNAISDSVKYETIKFSFPKLWGNYVKTAVFKSEDTIVSVLLDKDNELCLSENECYIPHEVLNFPGFSLSVFGNEGDTLATTASGFVTVLKSGYEQGEAPKEPTPNEYSQVLAVMNEAKDIAQSVRDDANTGAFKGDKGDKGDKGEDAITDQTYNPKSENAQSGKAVAEAQKNIADFSTFNTPINDNYQKFIDKYQLRNKRVDLSFVGSPKYYTSLATALNDVNSEIRDNGTDLESGAVAVTFYNGEITVLRLLADVTITPKTLITKSVIFDINGKTVTSTGGTGNNTMFYSSGTYNDISVIFYDYKGGTVVANEIKATFNFRIRLAGLYGVKVISNTTKTSASAQSMLVYDYSSMNLEICGCDFELTDTTAKSSSEYFATCVMVQNGGCYINNSKIKTNGVNQIYGLYCHNTASLKSKINVVVKNSNVEAIGTTAASADFCAGIITETGKTTSNDLCFFYFENCVVNGTVTSNYETGIGLYSATNSNTTLVNCKFSGVHSGIQNGGTMYIKKCYSTSASHGGFYNISNGKAYVIDSEFHRIPTGHGVGGSGTAYFSNGSVAYIDNCKFVETYFVVKFNTINGTKVYISNSTVPENKVRVDNTCFLFCGENMPQEVINVATLTGTITNTDEDYRIETKPSNPILNEYREKQSKTLKTAFDMFEKSGLFTEENLLKFVEFIKAQIGTE